MSDIVLGIKLRYDGKEVTGGLAVNRDQFRQIAIESRKAGEATAGGFTSAAQGVRSMSTQLDHAKNAVVGYLGVTQGVQAARWILDQASAMTQLDARLKVATSSAAEYARAQTGVFEVANRWGAAVEQTAGAFARLNPVVAQLGGNSTTTLKMLDGLAASLRLSGATAGETSSVMQQFSQAMGSGRVSGDEFRSMMENAEPLMRAVAGELGKTTAELRQMAEDGKLTSSVFGNALLPAIDKLKAKAEQIPLGISQAWQVLENNLKKDFGREFDGQATVVGSALKGISDHSVEAAVAVHAAADAVVALGQASAVVGAGAAGVWIAKQGQAAVSSTQAFMASRAARIADAQAAELQAAADVKRAETTLALMAAERERALATLNASNATIRSTADAGAHSAALRFGAEAAAKKSAALLMLTDASKIQSIATRELAMAETTLWTAQAKTAEATAISVGKAGLAGSAMTALGGPIGLVTLALTAGATAWALWGDKAESASDKAKKSIDAALERADRRAKEAKFGAGEIGQDVEALTNVQAQLADAKRSADTAIYEHIREAAREDVRKLESEEKRIKASIEQAQKSAPTPAADKPLSAAGEWGKLTESLEWRAKIVKKYNDDLASMEKSHADRMREAAADKKPEIQAEYDAAVAAKRAAHKAALEGLPDVKEAKAAAEAAADARVRGAEAASKRVLEVLKHEHEQYRLSTTDYLNTMAAVKGNAIGQEISALQAKLAAATKESERIPLREKIKELQAQLAAIPADTAAAFEDAARKADQAMLKMAESAGKAAGPLAQGARFAAEWGKDMQQAVADGNQAMIEMGRAVWENMAGEAQFTEAKQRFEELFAEMTAELERVRQAAEQDGGVLAALDADGQTAIIKNQFIPQLRAARAEMAAMRRESPVNGKAVADAGREIERVANELSPFWKNFWGEMHQGLTTELMRSANQEGRSFGESFVTGVKAYFKTAGLKLGVQLVGDLAIGGVKSALGFGGGASNGINALSSANSAYSLYNGGLNLGFAQAAVNTGTYMAAGSMGMQQAAMLAAQDSVFGAAGTAATLEAAGASSMMSSFATAAPYVAAAIVAAEAFGLFGDDDDRQRNLVGRGVEGTVSRGGLDGSLVSLWGTAPNDYWGGSTFDAIPDTALRTINAQIAAVFAAAEAGAAALGVTATALGDVTYAFGAAGRGIDVEFADALSATAERLARAVIPNIADYQAANESLGQTFARVVGDVTAVKQIFASMGRDFTATGADAAALAERVVGAFGGAGALATSWQSYKQTYYSEEELRAETTAQLTEVFAQLNRTMPTTRAGFRALVGELDLTTAAELQTFRALMSVEQAFASITPAADSAATVMQSYADAVAGAQSDLLASYRDELSAKSAIAGRMSGYVQSLRTFGAALVVGNLSPLGPREKYDEARRQLDDIRRRAALGDDSAYDELQPVAQAFLEASQQFNASSSQYATDFAWAQSIVEDSRSTADRIASAAQAQAAALQSQISLLDANVRATLSVADAVGTLQQAVIAAIGAGASVSAATKNAAGIYTAGGGATYSAANDLWTSADGTQSGSMAAVRATAQGILASAGPRALYDGWKSVGGSLADLSTILGPNAGSAEDWARQNGLPLFANGGDHVGGLRGVGERGFELEATGPARYWSHDQTVNMLRAANDPGSATSGHEHIAELRRQTAAIDRLNGLLETLIERGDSAASSADIRSLKQHLAHVMSKRAA